MDEQEAQCATAPPIDPNQKKYIGPYYSDMYWEWKDRQEADPIEVLADTINHKDEQRNNRETAAAMHTYGVIDKLDATLRDLDKVVDAHSMSFVHATNQRSSLMEVQEAQQMIQDDLSERIEAVTDMNKKVMTTLGEVMSRVAELNKKVDNHSGGGRPIEAQPFA